MTTTCTTGFDGQATSAREAVARTAGVVSLAVLAVGLGGLALGIDWAWVVFPVGYGGVLPLAMARAKARASSDRSAGQAGGFDGGQSGADDALATLRQRYASGEIDDAEFERRVERLLESDEREGY